MTGVLFNGDKARFNRVRRQNAAKRMRNRELLKSLVAQGKPAAAAKPVKA
jgi:hypothetical protein